MKKMLFLVLALASAMVASAQNQEEGKTLYVINGEVVSEEVYKNMPAEEVKDTQIVKGVERVMLMRTAHPLLHFDATPISADEEPVVIVKKRTEGNSETKSVTVVAAKKAGELTALIPDVPLVEGMEKDYNLTTGLTVTVTVTQIY